jgi:hypothetical protein
MLESHSDGLGLRPANKVLGAREASLCGYRGPREGLSGMPRLRRRSESGCWQFRSGQKQTRRRRKCYSRGLCRRQSSAPHLLLLLIAGARVLAQAAQSKYLRTLIKMVWAKMCACVCVVGRSSKYLELSLGAGPRAPVHRFCTCRNVTVSASGRLDSRF